MRFVSKFATKVAFALVSNMYDGAFYEGGWILVRTSHKSDSTSFGNVTLVCKDHVQRLATNLEFLQRVFK